MATGESGHRARHGALLTSSQTCRRGVSPVASRETSVRSANGEGELRYFGMLVLLAVLLASALGAPVARAEVPPFWQRLAHCETDGRWNWGAGHRAGEGSTFVGGLGIYEPNWEAWKVHVYVAGPAWSATPEQQARVAAW